MPDKHHSAVPAATILPGATPIRLALSFEISPELSGLRLDKALVSHCTEHSRERIQHWITSGYVKINGEIKQKCNERVKGGEAVIIEAELPPPLTVEKQHVDFDVVYSDADVIVVNKPAGVVVHPAAGHWQGTLVNGLLDRFPELAHLPRAGIIHRIDKDTSGLLIVARNEIAYTALVNALQAREIHREYLAVVQGSLISGGTIDEPIGRHAHQKTRMQVREDGKPAVTHYRVAQRFAHHTLLKVQLETGRTHQIRTHLAHIRHPIVGDPIYGGRLYLPKGCPPELANYLTTFKRQALHAARLEFLQPTSKEPLQIEAPVPADFGRLLTLLGNC
jgi:23S rRNA pseudouridine1911/1915/1917 synthase